MASPRRISGIWSCRARIIAAHTDAPVACALDSTPFRILYATAQKASFRPITSTKIVCINPDIGASAPILCGGLMDFLFIAIVAVLFLVSFALCQGASRAAARLWTLYARKAAR
jgi:hypothetical protein